MESVLRDLGEVAGKEKHEPDQKAKPGKCSGKANGDKGGWPPINYSGCDAVAEHVIEDVSAWDLDQHMRDHPAEVYRRYGISISRQEQAVYTINIDVSSRFYDF